MNPKVSIIIPTYNRKKLLYRALCSALAQTYKNIEIVIVDDFSTDATFEMVSKNFENEIKSKRIVLLRNERNFGHPTSKNFGIEKSLGELIAFLDDDDFWMPDKLELQVIKLESENAGACFCGTLWIEGDKFLKQTIAKNRFVSFENGGPTSTWLIRKSVFDVIGNFDSEIPTNDDGELMVRLNKSDTKIVFVEIPLYVHFYYPATVSNSREGKIEGLERIVKKHEKNLNNYELSSLYLKMSILHLFSRKRKFRLIFMSIMCKPNLINILLLSVMLLPLFFGLFILNKIMDMKKYPKSFANRYVQ